MAVRADYFSADLTDYLVPAPRTCGRKQLCPPYQAQLIWDAIMPLLANCTPVAAGTSQLVTRNNVMTARNAKTFVKAMLKYFIESSTSPMAEYTPGDFIIFEADHPGQLAAVAAPPLPARPVVIAGTHQVTMEVELLVETILGVTSRRFPNPSTLRQFLRWYTKEAKRLSGDRLVRPSGLDQGMPLRFKTIAFDFCYGPLGNLSNQQALALNAAQFVAIEPAENVVNEDVRFHGGVVPSGSRRRF